MKPPLIALLALLPLLSGVSAPLAQERDPITPEDLLQLQRIAGLDVAPDGRSAVFAVRSIHGELDEGGRPEYRTHLHWIDLTRPDARPVALTHGERGGGGPVISPDGRSLAFVRASEDGESSGAQVWVLPLGTPGEARQVTRLEHGAGAPQWRPDSRALLVSSSIPLSEIAQQRSQAARACVASKRAQQL